MAKIKKLFRNFDMLYNMTVIWINYFDDTDMCRIKHIIDSSDRMCKE